ncbi:MAG: 2Fe-2S iron-sulfur cluster-binding protein [Ekhidna sp.]
MPNVVITNLQSKSIHCDGKRERLLDILLSETDYMHACGGKGKCTTCKAKIIYGEDHLNPKTESEMLFTKLNKLQMNERLTCQVQVQGSIEIEVPKETQLPHITYSK